MGPARAEFCNNQSSALQYFAIFLLSNSLIRDSDIARNDKDRNPENKMALAEEKRKLIQR